MLVLGLVACRVNFEKVEYDEAAPDAGELPRPEPFVCPASYVSTAGGHCYRFVTDTAKSWMKAEEECEAQGGHLAVIDDEGERAELDRAKPAGATDMWIGASELVATPFLNVTRQPLFANGGPDDGNCMQLEADGTTGASDCAGGDDYVCEIDGRRADPSTYR